MIAISSSIIWHLQVLQPYCQYVKKNLSFQKYKSKDEHYLMVLSIRDILQSSQFQSFLKALDKAWIMIGKLFVLQQLNLPSVRVRNNQHIAYFLNIMETIKIFNK